MDILYPVRVLKGPEDVFKRQDGRHSHVTFIATACLRAEELGRYGFGRVVNLRTRHSGLGVTMRDIYIAHSMEFQWIGFGGIPSRFGQLRTTMERRKWKYIVLCLVESKSNCGK
ncbi:hypothetical protein GQR58_011534 [Nymphon striatum]|nr:hypothetical protein GQR58_011534 [Nymphon striatum]